jgi:hypothetical protein
MEYEKEFGRSIREELGQQKTHFRVEVGGVSDE